MFELFVSDCVKIPVNAVVPAKETATADVVESVPPVVNDAPDLNSGRLDEAINPPVNVGVPLNVGAPVNVPARDPPFVNDGALLNVKGDAEPNVFPPVLLNVPVPPPGLMLKPPAVKLNPPVAII